ncbi:D-beta-hydroxybutyrate dehydrogenase, mitochondrial [Eurytemora carolleeae]|uniref:D-beta-hydroxybutyrate dehydrogenase, mitochondrial n=1 Tax=Eurytemora carolleeae TaxID=1294199 RepID=UPI000C782973|nr:D-beta-hydroxybutyrate dehydrogenase, mitochondrial [Eurytemora carolleeae]|eukprot:XP_023329800.1 D-beta-hydroxybutyrate dehydrogenase, mitochondrial-like [Eurytemora affinis]
MKFKVRADLDLAQRCLLVVIISITLSYIISFLLLSQYLLCQLFLTLGLGFAILQSSVQLEAEDKTVLITGCDTGFGLVLAKHLHSLGFTVFAGCLLADRDGMGAAELRQTGSKKMHVLQLDVTNQEDWSKVKQYIEKNIPTTANGLWGLVNNAGWATFGEVEWVSMENYKKAMDVNLNGAILGIKTMLPLIRQAKGRIVTITSGLGRFAVPTRSPYVASKYALEGFLDCLRYEMTSFGVSVSLLEPGNFIAGTNIFNEKFVKSQAEEMWANMNPEVKIAYGREHFDKKVDVMNSYMLNGCTDISPVIDSYTDALLDVFPQVRYQPMDLYFKTRCFIATHFPERIYQILYL